MAEYLGLQQPPTKKFRSGTSTNESEFGFDMLPSYETPETNIPQDLFDLPNDLNDTIENTQVQMQQQQAPQQQQTTAQQQLLTVQSTPTIASSSVNTILNQSSTTIYTGQPRVTFIPQQRGQLTSYQTPNLQRIQTIPPTSAIVRSANVISNGIQQHQTIYTQHSIQQQPQHSIQQQPQQSQQQQQQQQQQPQQHQQQIINTSGGLNRSVYHRIPTATSQQALTTTVVRQPQYNTTTLVNMNQNVPQMGPVKTSDPNNNSLFVTHVQVQQQQQTGLIGLPQTVTQTPIVQTNKIGSTVLPSINTPQLNQYQVQQQQVQSQQTNVVQPYSSVASIRPQTIDQTPTNYLVSGQSQPQTNVNPNLSGSTMTPSSSNTQATNPSQPHNEVQRKQFIQKQLVLLLHAHKCQQREKQMNGETTRTAPCTLPHCNTMKNVLQHMTRCTDNKTCNYPHCVTSRQIIMHWKQCNNSACPICQPLKTPSTFPKMNPSGSQPNASAPTANANTNMQIGSNTNQHTDRPITKEWQKRVTAEMRNHLVQKIITALIPAGDAAAIRDKRIANLATYAKRVESETFDIASNQEEYFHKLAEKIYKIQKELEDRREKKRLQEMQLGAQASVASGQTAINNYDEKLTLANQPGDPGQLNRTAGYSGYTSSLSSSSGNMVESKGRYDQSVTSNNLNGTLSNISNSNTSSNTFTVENVPANDNRNFYSTDTNNSMVGQLQLRPDLSRTTHIKTELVSPNTISFSASNVGAVKKKENNEGDGSRLVSSFTKMASNPSSNVTMSEDIKPQIPQIDATSKQLPKCPVQFTADELRTNLEPVIEKMIACEDSNPFRQPVDPVALNILDYPTIIKRPMDISTMQDKLVRGDYKNPLEFCDDAWLMFQNAWIYNKKTTRVYKMCTKLSEVFAEAIDPVMQKLGYCCGRQYCYLPQVMFCYGNQLCCQIPRDGNYYYYNNPDPSRFNLSGDKYTFCAKCFDTVKSDFIQVGDDPAQTLVDLPKNLFLAAKNDIQEPEVTIDCIVCSRRWHQVCALHLDQIWPEGFICDTCIREYNIKRTSNRYTALRLTATDLAKSLEKRVNEYLRNDKRPSGRVTIRILAASDKMCEVKPRMKKYYQNQIPDGYPYRTKAIFAFQEIEGVDVVLFGMHVQEYDSRCRAPNTRRVYVSYLDSVHFFRPKASRTEVYHEILIGYLEHAKQLGYVYAHIWACPPSEGDDYIFHCHPPEQRVPKPKRLQDWYKKMLDRAILERIVMEYKDIMKDCQDNQVQSALDIPYFEGDFWSNIMEESIKELDQEEERRKNEEVEAARAMEDVGFDDPIEPEDPTEISDKRKSANTHKKKNLKKTTATQRKVAKKQVSNCTDLLSKIFSTMEKHKEAFFVIRLRDPNAACPPVNDTDTLIQCDLMDTRDAFLNFARDKHYEFSSLRRAKFSTMALLYELHTSTTDKFTYNCNSCRQQCEIRYHCTVCDDFDLCEKCYNIEPKHEHKMDRSVPSIVDVSHDGEHNSMNSNDKSVASSQLQRQQSMQRCIEALLHAVNCRNANCVNRSCFRYKRVIQHTKECKGKNSQCNICKQVIFLCWYHAKTCVEQNCQVPFCTNLKTKIQKQRATSLQTDRRRMQAMMQQRPNSMQVQQAQTHPHHQSQGLVSQQQPHQAIAAAIPSNSYDSTGKPAPVTLIRAQQQGQVWPNQTLITVAQKPNNGKPIQQTPNQLSLLIGRVKQEPTVDDQQQQHQSQQQPQSQQQRADTNDQKQLIYSQIMNKTPGHRLPTPGTTASTLTGYIQQSGQVHAWHTSASQPQLNPPPSYSTATRLRHPALIQQQGQNPSPSHTLLGPIRSNSSTPPPTYLARTSSTPNLARAPFNLTLIRPSPFSSQQQQTQPHSQQQQQQQQQIQQQQASQDPSARL